MTPQRLGQVVGMLLIVILLLVFLTMAVKFLLWFWGL